MRKKMKSELVKKWKKAKKEADAATKEAEAANAAVAADTTKKGLSHKIWHHTKKFASATGRAASATGKAATKLAKSAHKKMLDAQAKRKAHQASIQKHEKAKRVTAAAEKRKHEGKVHIKEENSDLNSRKIILTLILPPSATAAVSKGTMGTTAKQHFEAIGSVTTRKKPKAAPSITRTPHQHTFNLPPSPQ